MRSLMSCLLATPPASPIRILVAFATPQITLDAKRAKLCVRTDSSASAQAEFPTGTALGVWRHVAIVQSRARLGTSTATVYLDGLQAGSTRLAYPQQASFGTLSIVFGHRASQGAATAIWSLGPVFMVEECLGSAVAPFPSRPFFDDDGVALFREK